MYLLLSQRGPVEVTVWVLGQDWRCCRWGGEPGAQPAHSGRGEGGDGRREKGGGIQFGWGFRPSSLVPGPHFVMSLIPMSFISPTLAL